MALPASAITDSASTDRVGAAIAAADASRLTLQVLDGGQLGFNRARLLYDSFAYFMSELRDEAGRSVRVEEHHEEWCELFQREPLLCLMAPRDHGKSWTLVSYLLWRCWRHNRDPETGLLLDDLPQGRFQAALFSDTLPQADLIFELLQNLMTADANRALFEDIIPGSRRRPGVKDRWASRRIRLRNGAEVLSRGYRTSTRGLHPDLIVCDDVLNDQNTLTQYQRDKVWRYFAAVLLPMNAAQYIVVGTALHLDDLLHRLRPNPKKPVTLIVGNRQARFRWVKYKAANFTDGKVLWSWKHSLADLKGKQLLDAILFAREYQNDPVDEASSLFPYRLTNRATNRGKTDTLVLVPWNVDDIAASPRDSQIVFVPIFRRAAEEFVVLGMDIAEGAEASSDYTVIKVATYNRWTGQRRLIWTFRRQGVPFDGDVMLLRMACAAFGVDIGVIEQNGFQRWLHAETMKHAETANRLVGHTTGQEKANFEQGVPSVRLALEHDLWIVPTGDPASADAAATWQAEMQAFAWKDGKLQGVGEHDDEVMAWYFLDRACKLIDEMVFKVDHAEPDVVTGEDIGLKPVTIGPSY